MMVNAELLGTSAMDKFIAMCFSSDLSLLHSKQICRF